MKERNFGVTMEERTRFWSGGTEMMNYLSDFIPLPNLASFDFCMI